MVGAEQEYFLVDRERYEQRLDLKLCGRTLLGAPPPKSQELDDHYFGRVRLRIASFMHELDETLWKLGVAAKTKHNEVAPTQHELATVYDSANLTCDANHLVMETMKVVAKKHGLACLLHEKPFYGVNGSGKHNNYSLCTDQGKNLLSPGEHPENNLTFILFLAAFVRGVDRYATQLRMSTATPGNDCRLGGYEAPPAIISMFLGERYTSLLAKCSNEDHGSGKRPFRSGSRPCRRSFQMTLTETAPRRLPLPETSLSSAWWVRLNRLRWPTLCSMLWLPRASRFLPPDWSRAPRSSAPSGKLPVKPMRHMAGSS